MNQHVSENVRSRLNVGAMRVSGKHDRKPPVVFDPAEDVEDIYINVPHEQLENDRWGQRTMVFSQSANDRQQGFREWRHYVQESKDEPKRFRMALVHEHPSKHEPQYYTMEYTDYGHFKQNDPELVSKLPAEVYQAMLGMSVALREVKLMTLDALAAGEFDKPDKQRPDRWTPAPGIYAVSLVEEGAISGQWEMGIAVSEQSPPHYRAFARDVDSEEEFGLYTTEDGKFEPSRPGMKDLLPEEVYSGLVGLSIGCKTARAMTLDMHEKGQIRHNPKEQNKNRGFCNQLRQERRSAVEKTLEREI